MGSVAHLAERLEADLYGYLPELYKNPLAKLATMVCAVIEARSCNLMEVAARLPIETQNITSRYAWIERFLSAETIDDRDAMEPFADEVLAAVMARGETIVISLDQTCVNDTHGIAMMSVRVGERALPLCWTVKACKGNLPVKEYTPLLAWLKTMIPYQAKVLVLADRFFGTPELIRCCQQYDFAYRIRLKGNLNLVHEEGEMRVDEMPRLSPQGLCGAKLAGSEVETNVGFIHETGHPEPWFIAMNATPSRTTVLDYGLRWGIETLFSDYKSRGFGLESTHLQRPDRLSRLILVLSIGLYWATANGRQLQKKHRKKVV
jgi:hypothetical protein